MWNDIWSFISSVPLWEVLLILFAKVIEVAISTL